MATYDKILLQSGRNEKNLLEHQGNQIKPKHFTPFNKKVILPKINFFDYPENMSPMRRLKELHSEDNRRRIGTSKSERRIVINKSQQKDA